jgi:hypothetical protein
VTRYQNKEKFFRNNNDSVSEALWAFNYTDEG